jgi:hypothetical protein
VRAADFGYSDDPNESAIEDVRETRHLSPAERYKRFLQLIRFMESIWKSIDPERRKAYLRVEEELDDPGRWWERARDWHEPAA